MNDEEMSFNQVRVSMKGVTMHIKVKAVKQYGAWVYYPQCEKAKVFAQIAGTQTLTVPVLMHIKTLGYELDMKTEQPSFQPVLEQ